jgi:hypothetical protein
MWTYRLCDNYVSQTCHLTGQPRFLTWQFFLVGQTHTWKSKCTCTNISHFRSWNSTSEMKSQWLIKVCSKQLWLISNQNYRNVLHTRETTFLGQHGVYVCLLIEMHLRSNETFQMANYVCHCTASLTERWNSYTGPMGYRSLRWFHPRCKTPGG